MNDSKISLRGLKRAFIGSCLLSLLLGGAHAQSNDELQKQVEQLTRQLQAAQQELASSEQKRVEAERALKSLAAREEAVAEKETTLADAVDPGPSKITPGDLIPALEGLEIGGAIRANYAFGDYGDETGGPSRAEGDGGNFALDTFRINADYSRGPWLGKMEYRFYNGYHFLHTGWVGYDFDNDGQVQVGVNRVPFGPGPYGNSQSWFFDQHYYAGLSDDMDFGVKYATEIGRLSIDLAYYYSDEGQWAGDSNDAARYSYDVIDESGTGYEERNQFNIRVVRPSQWGEVEVDLGASAQYGMLESNGPQDDGDHYALSLHPVFKWNNWTLAPQLTYYNYDIDGYLEGDPDGDLIQIGAYDFPTLLATEAWIPSVSLSYYYEVDQIDWLDYVIPYVEYSSILKEASDFEDSELLTFGAAWARGGWYVYTDLVYSNGNDFVGNESDFNEPERLGRVGGNLEDEWEYRFNINFGYYF